MSKIDPDFVYIPPTVELLDNVSSKLSSCANDLDFARRIEGLREDHKKEIWKIVLQLTQYSAALSRIRMLTK